MFLTKIFNTLFKSRQVRNNYLIEFRFQGRSKREIKNFISNIDYKFNIKKYKKHRIVPHISLVGPFTTNNEKKLISDFSNIPKKYSIMRFKTDGYNTFEHSEVIHIKIKSNKNLDKLRWELVTKLKDYCKLKPFDYNENFNYHSTIAMNIPTHKFNKIKKYVFKLNQPKYENHLTRLTLLRNSKILFEYDFFLKRILNRKQARNKLILAQTKNKLKKIIKNRN